MTEEVTSERVAKVAAKGLRNPQTLTMEEVRTVCASALTQVGIDPVEIVKNPFATEADERQEVKELDDDWTNVSALFSEGKYVFRYNHKTRELTLGEGYTAETALKALLDEKYEEQERHKEKHHGK